MLSPFSQCAPWIGTGTLQHTEVDVEDIEALRPWDFISSS